MSDLAKTLQRPAMAGTCSAPAAMADEDLDGKAEAFGLDIQKSPGAGGAQLVHGIVGSALFIHQDELGILTADLDHRSPALKQTGRGVTMGHDLVDRRNAEQFLDNFLAAARGHGPGKSAHVLRVHELLQQLPAQGSDRVPRTAPHFAVGMPAHPAGSVENNTVQAHRPEINAEVTPFVHVL